MGVEILIQDLCGLFAEVASFAPDETRAGYKYWEKKMCDHLPFLLLIRFCKTSTRHINKAEYFYVWHRVELQPVFTA